MNQRPAITKDLNAIYDKYDCRKGSRPASQSFASQGNSPAKESKVVLGQRNPPTSVSAKKRSMSRGYKLHQTTQIDVDE